MVLKVQIDELLAKLEAAAGPDRVLDHAIYDALKPTLEVYSTFAPSGDLGAHWYWMASHEYTASIDAALALVERVLPTLYHFEFDYNASGLASMAYVAQLDFTVESPPTMREAHGQSSTLPIAILIALLRALESETPA